MKPSANTHSPTRAHARCAPTPTDFPVARISANGVHAEICLPDSDAGYYRGTRFDWAGVIRDLRWRGHRYFDEWFPAHDPLCHDGICGPVDEFTQTGYEDAAEGDEFLKIGVGALRKTTDAPYDRFQTYPISNKGKRQTGISADRVDFQHTLTSGDLAYDYRKTLQLTTDKPGLRLEYALKNTGAKPLEGQVYNHNFFTIDGMTTGPDTEIRLPFRPEGDWREAYDSVALTDTGINFSRELNAGEKVFMGNLHGHDPAQTGYAFELHNRKSGAGVRAKGSGHLSHIVFWACPATACIEPYTTRQVHPGQTARWTIEYEFFER
ncbi:hypothetical protein M2447_001201 [Ereboglobus sp. PH5-10]|uniref:hypothetical protein n=1 Tax=Ereboglobus sp. PH5-10 TaxID=2940629 RepID=UPI002406911D|nr:hypothetical protein [Ereboglobus sp. PH5-10]MDF9827112.1 hypothetical protein [Ereboglobus sp. PH5-10]